MAKKRNSFLKKLIRLRNHLRGTFYQPAYRLLSVKKTETDEYLATIQLIGKRVTFEMKPEEILSDDNLTDKFSPRDIRALTYLGYLGINSPKYQILARKLAENEQVLFVLHKKGSKKVHLKTAEELAQNKEILENLSREDTRTIEHVVTKKSVLNEKALKEKAIGRLENKKI